MANRDDYLLTPHEVSVYLGLKPRAVMHLANTGKLKPIFTLGGHRRYRTSEVHAYKRER